MNRDRNCVITGVVKAEFVEGQRQTHATRLNIGFLESPVLEESVLLLVRRRGGKYCNFLWRKIAISHLNRCLPRTEILDIHPQGPTLGYAYNDQAVRVRNIERQAFVSRLRIDNLGAPVGICCKDPLPGMDGYVARQYRPHQGSSNQVAAPIPHEIKPLLLPPFRSIEQFSIGGVQERLGYFIEKSEPQMNLGRRERYDLVSSRC